MQDLDYYDDVDSDVRENFHEEEELEKISRFTDYYAAAQAGYVPQVAAAIPANLNRSDAVVADPQEALGIIEEKGKPIYAVAMQGGSDLGKLLLWL